MRKYCSMYCIHWPSTVLGAFFMCHYAVRALVQYMTLSFNPHTGQPMTKLLKVSLKAPDDVCVKVLKHSSL